ncbi:MAG: tetratricopeptide repeat protein [Pseudomonadota bacterium]
MSAVLSNITSLCVGTAALGLGDPTAALQTATSASGLSISALGAMIGKRDEAPQVLDRVRKQHSRQRQGAPKHHKQAYDTIDELIETNAETLFLDKAALVGTAFEKERFPDGATSLLLNQLAITDADHPDYAVRYARAILRDGLVAAMEKKAFFEAFKLEMSVEQAHQTGIIRRDVEVIRDGVERLGDMPADIAAIRSILEGRLGVLPDPLLLSLAKQFGYSATASDQSALISFLEDKAEDYKKMQTRIAELAAEDARMANILSAVEGALASGEFEEADSLLADAEDIQQENKTLLEVRKQANLRVERGRAALLNGKTDQAFDHFNRAAEFFFPFDPKETFLERDALAQELFHHGMRFGGQGLERSVSLFGANARLTAEVIGAYHWAWGKNSLAIALQNQGTRTGGAGGTDLLAQAVKAYRDALTIYTKADHPVDWAITQNNLAGALEEQGSRTGGAEGTDLLAQAVKAYRDALTVSTKADHPVQWATTQNNLANALTQQGTRIGGAEGTNLLEKAVKAYRDALTVRTKADHPVGWAMTQNNLAAALQEQGTRTGGTEGTDLLAQAVKAYRDALTVRTKADHPVQWAITQGNLAQAHVAWTELEPERAGEHLEEALEHVERSLEVFHPDHMTYNFEKAEKLKGTIERKLAEL